MYSGTLGFVKFWEVNFPFPDKSGRFFGFPVESLRAVVSIPFGIVAQLIGSGCFWSPLRLIGESCAPCPG